MVGVALFPAAAVSVQMTMFTPKITLRKLLFVTSLIVAFSLGRVFDDWMRRSDDCHFNREFGHLTRSLIINTTHGPFPPPEAVTERTPDSIDTFASYKWHDHPQCQISSLDLHSPFAPLCSDRRSFLTAFSNGGRIGKNAPFMPRGCDMRWYSTEEVCEILSRFERVIVVGDSMMRHIVGAINVLIRRDLGYGAVTDWNFNQEERDDCFCNQQFNVKACSVQGIFKTSDVELNDPSSVACGLGKIDLIIEMMLKWPPPSEETARLRSLLSTTKPNRPYAFVLGHGLWNDLDLVSTVNWITEIISQAESAAPYLATQDALFPRLMVTPNAAGPMKPDQWIVSQGDKALQWFEESVSEDCRERWPGIEQGGSKKIGVEHMGTWNMSIQAEKYDGVHLDLKGNLIKAMGVLNWLAGVPVHDW